jgi:hypothetical protein
VGCSGSDEPASFLDDSGETSSGTGGTSFNHGGTGGIGGAGGTFVAGGSSGSGGNGGDDSVSEGGGGTSGNDDEDFIAASWLQTVGDCEYVHTFTRAGVYSIDCTTGERVKADYSLTPPPTSGGRWQMDFTIVSDNNVVDCEGQQHDETGAMYTAFVALIDADHLGVYHTLAGGTPAFVWEKL